MLNKNGVGLRNRRTRFEINKLPGHTEDTPYLHDINQQQFLSLVGAVYEKYLVTDILYININIIISIIITIIISVMQLGHLLTRSGLTYPEVSSKVYLDSFCQLDSSISLPWVIYFEAFYLHVVSSFSCIPVIFPKLVLFLTPLQFVHLFCNLSQVYPAVLLMYFIAAAVILLASLALIFQVSLPYNKTGSASVLCSFILVFLRAFCGINTCNFQNVI